MGASALPGRPRDLVWRPAPPRPCALQDENQKVKTITALCLAALAEAATPYGIESFDDVLEPLWRGIRSLRGKVLAAFLKAIGHIIPLMDAEHAFYYTREVMVVLRREFATPDEEMKKIVLKVVQQCVGTDGVEPDYIRTEILPDFFKAGWGLRPGMGRERAGRGLLGLRGPEPPKGLGRQGSRQAASLSWLGGTWAGAAAEVPLAA